MDHRINTHMDTPHLQTPHALPQTPHAMNTSGLGQRLPLVRCSQPGRGIGTPRASSALVLTAALLIATGLFTGCASKPATDPYAPLSELDRNSTLARQLNEQASSIMEKDPAKAESLLREALAADLYCGPAHNNLGVLYLKQQKLYEAAAEFEWARRLMPGHPDPRMNLAMTLEAAGRSVDALDAYATALEVYPDHLPTMQAMTSLQLRTGKSDHRTHHMLREIALRGESDTWKSWARTQLALREGE
jgi:Flp pilus assembly protein TadD